MDFCACRFLCNQLLYQETFFFGPEHLPCSRSLAVEDISENVIVTDINLVVINSGKTLNFKKLSVEFQLILDQLMHTNFP